MAEEYKHSFIDEYPYLVYTDEVNTLVYSDCANTSIDDIGGGSTLGRLAEIAQLRETPAIGMDAENNFSNAIIYGVLDGDAVVTWAGDCLDNVAVGATVFFLNNDGAALSDWSAYGCIAEPNELDSALYTSVREINLNGEIKTITLGEDEYECVVFQVPTLDVDNQEALGIVYTGE